MQDETKPIGERKRERPPSISTKIPPSRNIHFPGLRYRIDRVRADKEGWWYGK